MENSKRTEIGELGEFGLINRLSENVRSENASTITGIGDDAAIIDQGDEFLLMSKDLLIEGIHFDLSYTPLKHLGYKAVAVNVSDIAAMNGTPREILVGLAISNRFSVEALEEVYEGMRMACDNYNVDLVGGDTTSSTSGLMISITVTGVVDKDKVAKRSGAQEGDIVCVTGDLGAAYLGLQLLEREKQVFLENPEMQPELDGKDYLVQRILKPEARLDVVHDLKEEGIIPTSMIDISDGLASELLHICKQSDVGVHIMDGQVPVSEEAKQLAMDFNISPDACAFNGGEDYELLMTFSQEDYEKVKKNPEIQPIGQIVPKKEGIKLVTSSGNLIDLKAQGWQHFKED